MHINYQNILRCSLKNLLFCFSQSMMQRRNIAQYNVVCVSVTDTFCFYSQLSLIDQSCKVAMLSSITLQTSQGSAMQTKSV